MKRVFQMTMLAVALLIPAIAFSAETNADLAKEFASPAKEYQPWVFWFWNNGNITREGITADLEAMQRVGIKGVLIMEVGQAAPRGKVDFLSDEWRELFHFMLNEAKRCGIEVNMNNDAGWNGSGGKWIKPEEAMQILTFTEASSADIVDGKIKLQQPATRHNFYRDIAVFAFPTPKDQTGKTAIDPNRNSRDGNNTKAIIAKDKILNLTDKFSNGELTWTSPEGTWTILRVGHTCKGHVVAPAPESGVGLECDKLSIKGTDAAFAGQIGKLAAENKTLVGSAFLSTHIDSWENGSQNWTEKMREEFQQRRKYDVFPYLPVFAGYIVNSTDETDSFLWDFRRTVSEMILDNHVRRMYQLAHQNGLRLSLEAYGAPTDSMEYGSIADEPTGEFWIGGHALNTCRAMASVSHVYGKPVTGAEAFTADNKERWLYHPGNMKTLGDQAFSEGIQRFVFHRYSFQPWKDIKPGLMMGPWGVHYERTQTWWEQSKAWHDYLTRCQYLLRQGKYVADILYVESEEHDGFADHRHAKSGYAWDQCGVHAVLQSKIINGEIVTPGGLSYKVLVLPPNKKATLNLIRQTSAFLNLGATIIGARPESLLGLSYNHEEKQEFASLVNKIWGDSNESSGERRVGNGRMIWGKTPEEVLAQQKISPDFLSDIPLHEIHRKTENAEIYFTANPQESFIMPKVTFRAAGQPELWYPETGKIVPVAAYQTDGTVTSMLLPLHETESVFVVFHKNETPKNETILSITHDGKFLGSLKGDKIDLPVIKILKASYGDPRVFDVREKLQKMIDAGKTEFVVSEMAKPVDPAFGVLKTLEIEYEADGKTQTWKGDDHAKVSLKFPAMKILKAKYGPPTDGPGMIDVREKLQKLFDAGKTYFPVTDLANPIDPAFKVVKTLEIQYEVEGKTHIWSGQDGAFVNPEQFQTITAEPSIAKNGKPAIDVWQSGNYEVKLASNKTWKANVTLPKPSDISENWQASFPKKEVAFDKLISWSDSNDDYVKYFSGTAVYRKSFNVPKDFLTSDQRVYLDLGKVNAIAELKINKKDFGILWTLTKVIDITDALKADGNNQIEIRVTNLWPNRLIGDAHLPDDAERNPNGTLTQWPAWLLQGHPIPNGRETFCMWNLWKKDDALQPSGLIGPVRLLPVKKFVVE